MYSSCSRWPGLTETDNSNATVILRNATVLLCNATVLLHNATVLLRNATVLLRNATVLLRNVTVLRTIFKSYLNYHHSSANSVWVCAESSEISWALYLHLTNVKHRTTISLAISKHVHTFICEKKIELISTYNIINTLFTQVWMDGAPKGKTQMHLEYIHLGARSKKSLNVGHAFGSSLCCCSFFFFFWCVERSVMTSNIPWPSRLLYVLIKAFQESTGTQTNCKLTDWQQKISW